MGRSKQLVGIRRWKSGWQAYVQIQGKTYSKSFGIATEIATMKTWREDQKKKLTPVAPLGGSFAADIETYLSRITARRSYKQTVHYLGLWRGALGGSRARTSITATEIDRVLQGWTAGGTSVATIRKRRSVLLAMFHTLDGRQSANPVRASHAPPPPKPETKALDYPTIERILRGMEESQTKRRLTVLAYTGIPPGMLAAVTPDDLQLEARTIRMRPRRKGKGVEARTLWLTAQGADALRAFDRANAYGTYSLEAANRVFKRACQRVGVTQPATLYSLRHSFATALYRVTRDLATVSRFLLHSTPAMSARYAQAAMSDVDQAAARALGRSLSSKPVRRRKARKQRHLRKVS